MSAKIPWMVAEKCAENGVPKTTIVMAEGWFDARKAGQAELGVEQVEAVRCDSVSQRGRK